LGRELARRKAAIYTQNNTKTELAVARQRPARNNGSIVVSRVFYVVRS
jgi:hypothetical protein